MKNRMIRWIFTVVTLWCLGLSSAWAQCGVTMSCGGGGTLLPVAECQVKACFQNQAAKSKYEIDNGCKFKPCTNEINDIPMSVLVEIFPSSVASNRLQVIDDELNLILKNPNGKNLINSKYKMANFLAQIKQEIGASMVIEENLNYRASVLAQKFSYFKNNPAEAELYGKTNAHPADQKAIANRIYGNRMGNSSVDSGDGWRYRGRGVIQLTGKSNYRMMSEVYLKIWNSNVDFISNPDFLLEDIYAVRAGLSFWSWNKLDVISDQGVTRYVSDKVTKVVNSGTNTYGDRFDNLNSIMSLDFFKVC